MNKILFQYNDYLLKGKHVFILYFVIVLLLFGFKSCSMHNINKLKEEMISDFCSFTSDNVNDLNTLLSRADLCSDDWFTDYQIFLDRIAEQAILIAQINTIQYYTLGIAQVKLYNALEKIHLEQNLENIDELEIYFKEYKSYIESYCGANW